MNSVFITKDRHGDRDTNSGTDARTNLKKVIWK